MAEEKKIKKNTKGNKATKSTKKKENISKLENKNIKEEKVVENNTVEKDITTEKTKVQEVKSDALDNEEDKVKEFVNDIYDFNDDGRTTKSKRGIIIAFFIGLLIGLLIMLICPGRVAKLANGEEVIVEINDKKITANDLYKDMKNYYKIELLLNTVDNIILTDLYPEDNEMKKEINEMADYYISMYESYYGYTEEEFLKASNFKSREEFLDALKLDYRRTKYYEEYLKKLITDEDITDYYNNKVFGETDTKYISISKSNENAIDLANEIINKLNNGSTYNDIVTEYGERIKAENLEFVSFKNELGEEYLTTLKNLDPYTYSVNPVESSTDYKIIFKGEEKEKQKLDEIKNDIIEILSNKKKEDGTLTFKALIEMRKEGNVEFKDSSFAKMYDSYIKENTKVDGE